MRRPAGAVAPARTGRASALLRTAAGRYAVQTWISVTPLLITVNEAGR